MWKKILHDSRFSYPDVLAISIVGRAMHEQDWQSVGITTVVWFAVTMLIKMHYMTKR